MNIGLAAQTLSSSVAPTVYYMRKEANLPKVV